MYRHILVTLDGSDLAERALQPAFLFAEKFGAEVTLLRVMPADEDIVALAGSGPQSLKLNDLREARERAESEAYLRAIQSQWQATGVRVSTQVAFGAAPELIVHVADQINADLIVMSTHGRSGLSRFLYGSVAEAVLRGTQLPLLLIPVK